MTTLFLKRAALVLADGACFQGFAFGAMEQEVCGELVFSTAMTGYVELLTDPSYHRQILVLTCSEIGNCGVAKSDMESAGIFAKGLVVRELSPMASNWRSDISLNDWLKEEGVAGIYGIDTRALVHHLRSNGSQMAILSTVQSYDVFDLHQRAYQLKSMDGAELASEVSTKVIFDFQQGLVGTDGLEISTLSKDRFHVVVIDFGVKRNMLRLLVHYGCRVTVLPYDVLPQRILDLKPDGLLLSNGPGDPVKARAAINAVKALLGLLPIFGICMGHQVLALAAGAKTFKLKFGHRGVNQPVIGSDTRVMTTSQNHGFSVSDSTFNSAFQITQKNLSDDTIEGLTVLDKFAFGVQYHPEAAPGPHDTQMHFVQFLSNMEIWKNAENQNEPSLCRREICVTT
jgi:carbamoyl-phosphate synthase small subunit